MARPVLSTLIVTIVLLPAALSADPAGRADHILRSSAPVDCPGPAGGLLRAFAYPAGESDSWKAPPGPRASLHPNPGDTLLWDDGTPWTMAYYFDPGNGWGVEFEPLYHPCRVTSLIIWFNDGFPIPGGDDLILAVLDDDGPDGAPGSVIFADTLLDVPDFQPGAWNEFAVGAGDTGIVVTDGSFYGVYVQYDFSPGCPSVAWDNGYTEQHCWAFYQNSWAPSGVYGDMLLRAAIERAGGDAHDAGVKTILSPGADFDPGTPIVPSAIVKNFGTFTESFDVNCLLETEGMTVYDENAAVSSLSPEESREVSFPSFTGEAGTVYEATFTTLLDPDDTPMNDSRSTLTKNYTRTRRAVLAEGGTGTWCPHCPEAAQGLDSLRHVAGDSVAVVEYHYQDAFANAGSSGRLDYYNIDAYPTVVFDGVSRVVGGGSGMYSAYRMRTDESFAANVPVDLVLEGGYDDQSREGFALVTIEAVDGIAETDLRLYTVLTESHIAFEWQGEDSLQFVMRGIFPDLSGIPVELSKGETRRDTISFNVSADYVDTNCDLVVFLQDYPTREVLGARTAPVTELAVGIEDGDDTARAPRVLELFQNYPNPFNPRTRIDYTVPDGRPERVELAVYSIRGLHVRTLVSEIKEPGVYSVVWDGRDDAGGRAASGVYLYRLRVGDEVLTSKMLLAR